MVIQKSVKIFKKYQTFFVFLLIFGLSLFLFYPSLNYYFFQDDWFVLNRVRAGDLASFFQFRTDIIYWRPLSMPLFFAVNKTLFGLNPFRFHLVAFFLFFLLIIVIYFLFKILTCDRKLSLLMSFFYAIWPIHFTSLSWLSTTSYVIGPLFQVLSFIFFANFVKRRKFLLWLVSFLFFLFGLASSELTIVLPAVFFAWGLFIKKQKYLKLLLPFIAVVCAYLFLRIFLFKIPSRGAYQIYFNWQIINNFFWYLGWAMGLPESFKSLIFPSLPEQSMKIIIQFWRITIPFLLICLLIIKMITNKFGKNFRLYLFAFFWVFIGLVPVITLINHSSPMYLSFSGLGFLYALTFALRASPKIFWMLLTILWTVISFTNLEFTRATHWIRNEQAISRAYMTYVKEHISHARAESIFLFRPADLSFAKKHNFVLVETEDTLRQSLNEQDAIQVIYNDSSLQSIYAKAQDQIKLPSSFKVFEIIPRIDD